MSDQPKIPIKSAIKGTLEVDDDRSLQAWSHIIFGHKGAYKDCELCKKGKVKE